MIFALTTELILAIRRFFPNLTLNKEMPMQLCVANHVGYRRRLHQPFRVKVYARRLEVGVGITYNNEGLMKTIEFIRQSHCQVLAEVGIAMGDTSEAFARHLNGRGQLHLFDYSEKVNCVQKRLESLGFTNIVSHGNSHRTYDSYNWNLMKLLQTHQQGIFDYVYLDGAHTWHHDALAFVLIDQLLKNGGFVEFDDYNWNHRRSSTVNPTICPATVEGFTEEQIDTHQVALVVDLLVKRDGRYKAIVKNRIYQKAD